MAAWWIALCLFSADSDAGNHMHTLHCQPQLRCCIPLMPPHAFTSFTSLSICSTFPFHPSFSSFSPERLVCEWARCGFYRRLAAAPGTKGSRNATMSLYSARAQMRTHWKDIQSSVREKIGCRWGWMDGYRQGGWGGGGWEFCNWSS